MRVRISGEEAKTDSRVGYGMRMGGNVLFSRLSRVGYGAGLLPISTRSCCATDLGR